MKALCESSSQARRHFTRFDQVEQLVRASEADPARGFMARLLMLCSLPRTNPGNRHQYKRVNGPYTLYMIAGGGNQLSRGVALSGQKSLPDGPRALRVSFPPFGYPIASGACESVFHKSPVIRGVFQDETPRHSYS